jgi:lysophospholipase L1-like esterase
MAMTELNICVLGDGFAMGLGDPNMQGWAGLLMQATSKELGEIHYFNLGIPNDTSKGCAERVRELVPRAMKGQDNRLILCFGLSDTEVTEDGKPKLSNQESLEALKSLVVKTKPHFKMLMIGIPPSYEPQRNNRIKRLNTQFREFCQKARVPYVDLFSVLSDDVQYKRQLSKGNRIYPSRQGYEKVFDLIWNDRSWWFNP